MITFNNIVERFEIFAENHFFIKSFSFGSPDDVDLSKFEEFPLMHLVYTGATYDAGTKTYNLEVYILDVPNDKKGKVIPQKEAISDSEQCAEDILADIRMGGNIFLFAQDYEVVNATTTPLEEETKNVLSGVLLDLSVAIPYEWDACNAPIDGVAPGGGEVVYARRGVLRMLTLDGSTDVQSVRTIKVTNGTLTDDGDGVVTLDTGGVETLEALTDVTITNAANGQVIKYLNGIWINAADGGAISLNDLTDVIISQPAQGEFFRYDGGEWVNDTASKSDVGLGNVDNTSDANKPISTATQTALDLKADITSVPTELDDLNDVQIIGTPTLGQALVYGAGKWLPGAAGATDLGDLDDVNTTGAAFGSLLTYNGASWDISGSQLPTDDIYFHQRYETESEALRTGATATTELYFTCTAQGNGLAESASSDTPTAGKIIRRKIYYSEEGFADPDTGTWVEFTPAPADDAAFATVKAALLEYLKARTGGTVPISLKQTWEEVAAAPTFTGLLNETYGSGAAAAYGTRRLNGNYSGACMTIRRASDGTTQTIGFVGEEIDEAAIETFCTGSTCTVQVWHDQSQTGGTGSGNDATQTTPANQPTIYTGGQLVKEGGRLALDFSNDTFTLATSITTNALCIFSMHVDTANSYFPIRQGTTDYVWLHTGFGQLRAFMGGQFAIDSYSSKGTMALRSFIKKGTAGNGALNYVDGVNITTVGYDSLDTQTGTFTTIGSYTGQSQEIIIYTVDKSSNRTDIEGNISAYYQSAKLLDESYGSGAEAAYSVRQLKRDNTECMVIRRASDSTTTTIGFDGSGNIDEAAITTFCTGTTCTVYQWLDQSGNGNTATAPSTGAEPTIYTGGALVKENGKVAVSFDADYLEHSLSTSGGYSTSHLLIGLTSVNTPNNYSVTFGVGNNQDNVNGIALMTAAGTIPSNWGTYQSGSRWSTVSLSDGFRRLITMSRGASGNGNFYTDGTTSGTYNGTSGTTYTSLGHPNTKDNIQEVIFYASDKSSFRASIEENVGDYFTQNTPLLDTYSGAAAAYSLRLLDSTYTGSAIRVRRSSDNTEQDIGFNVFGELDTVSLLAFAGTGDAFVKVWYDQASTNDATQTTTANQPKIVSSGAVVVENGKPAVDFLSGSYTALKTGGNITNSSTLSFYSVFQMAAAAWQAISGIATDASNRNEFKIGSSRQYNIIGAGSQLNGPYIAIGQQTLAYAKLDSSSGELATNGNTATTGTNTSVQSVTNAPLAIGSRAHAGGESFTGTIQEVIYWVGTPPTRTDIETNIATFYGITL